MLNQFNASLWGDEAFSAVLSMKSIPEIVRIITRDTSPPLYNISEHLWFNIFGTSEIAIRALSFIFFLIAIFFTYKIGSYLFDRKTGILAALLTFLNPFFFTYAFEGRMYSLLAATVTASFYFFIKKNWIGYVLATTTALYTHHFAVFAVGLQGLCFLYEFFFEKRSLAISRLKAFLAVAILYGPWLIPLYNQTKMVGSGFWLGKPTFLDLRNLIYEYLATGIKHPLSQTALYLVLATFFLRIWSKSIKETIFLFLWFLFPIFTTWAFSQKFQSIFFNRYLLYTIPAGMLLLASEKRRLSLPLVLILIVLFTIVDWHYFTHPSKKPFGQLATYAKEVKREDGFLINWNSASHHLWESKYYGIPAPLYVPAGTQLPFYLGTALMTRDDIISSLPKKINRVGVITSGPIEEIALHGYTLNEAKVFGELKFVWYKKK